MERCYWNEDMETMQPAALRRLENEYLQTQLDYVWACSAFYQVKFAEVGLKREVIRALADLPLLPFTEKDECRCSQQEHPPFGSYLASSQEQLLRVHKTSGTTGRALYVALTRRDRNLMNECAARSFWAAGLRPSDTVVHCLNYRLWVGGFSDHENLETTGATVVPFGVGQTALLLQTIRELQINAISATPSYMLPLSEVVLAQGLNPRDDMLHVRGVNVFPTGVGNTLAHLSDQLSGEFQIIVDHAPPHQYLRVRVELAQNLASDQGGDLPQQIVQALREQLNFRAEPELVPYGTLPRTEQKARRVMKIYEQVGS